MHTTTETPINEIDTNLYRASLLAAYKTKSKYADLWQELKHHHKLVIHCNPSIYKHHKIFTDSLGLLHKKDSYFREFCRLTYNEELQFYSFYDKDLELLTIRLLTLKAYRQLRSIDRKQILNRRFE